MNDFQRRLTEQLEMVVSIKKSHERPVGIIYYGSEDFVLQHGVWHEVIPMPVKVNVGSPKHCFGNALALAAVRGYKYIEGFALSDRAAGLAYHHAWNLDEQSRLIDNTWMNQGDAYLGVEFSVGRADSATWFDNASVLDNYGNRYQLYRRRWTGEVHSLKWRRSKILKKALRGEL
jgi:hypothetical protein